MIEPAVKDFCFRIQEAARDSECIQLLVQVMKSYKDLNHIERKAVAAWFSQRYDY